MDATCKMMICLLLTVGSYMGSQAAIPCSAADSLLVHPIDPDMIIRQLSSGELPSGPAVTRAGGSGVHRCADGPVPVQHTVFEKIFLPSITKYSCQDLPCDDPPCFARSSNVEAKCVHVFNTNSGGIIYEGLQLQPFLNHTSCGCKTCSDIVLGASCTTTRPCPSSDNPESFCYWTPTLTTVGPKFEFGRQPQPVSPESEPPAASLSKDLPTMTVPDAGVCECCEPRTCLDNEVFVASRCECVCAISCLPNEVLNRETCECVCAVGCPEGEVLNEETCECESVCPEGTELNDKGECVGNCSLVNVKQCSQVKCVDNPHFNCAVLNHFQCKCPSCEDVPALSKLCTLTRCVEQPSKPRCRVDPCDDSCRCPKCAEQPDQGWCSNTYCGDNHDRQCRWNPLLHNCFCPGCSSRDTRNC